MVRCMPISALTEGSSAPRTARYRLPRWLASSLVVLLVLAGGWGIRSLAILRRPVVRVGLNKFSPYLDIGPNGTPVGFAAGMFTQAARQAKIDVRWIEFDGAADKALSEGKIDMYPLMTITPERESLFYMSAPWWENQFELISTKGREIPDKSAARGKVIATRVGMVQTLSQTLFPGAHFVDLQTLPEMEKALCDQKIDGFFSDVRLVQAQLMQRTKRCSGQALYAASVPDSKLSLGTASTKATASANDRIFREIAKMALNGTLSRTAAGWGVFMPYDTARLKQVLDAEGHEKVMAWALLATLLVLALSIIQTTAVRRARRDAELAHARARDMQYQFDEFMKHTPAITFIKDAGRRVIYSNEAFHDAQAPGVISGRPDENSGPIDVISRQLSLEDDDVLKLGRAVEVTETLRGADGTNRHFLVLKFPFRGAAGVRYLGGVALDVTARMVAEEELRHHAKIDLLTGLPNRRSFMTELQLAVEESCRRESSFAVCFVDLDGFKQVNDQMGHEAGDELLKHAAERLKRVCRKSDTVARIGGDEFTVLLPGVNPVAAQQIMGGALSALTEPFVIAGKKIIISASVGISLFPAHGTTPQQLLRNADTAMYAAKRNGRQRIELWSPAQTDQCLAVEETIRIA
jgi:diguanylate cyclase (GGDEF)-like protein